MITVTIDKAGKVTLPKEVLEESHIKPETEVVVIVAKEKITLLTASKLCESGWRW